MLSGGSGSTSARRLFSSFLRCRGVFALGRMMTGGFMRLTLRRMRFGFIAGRMCRRFGLITLFLFDGQLPPFGSEKFHNFFRFHLTEFALTFRPLFAAEDQIAALLSRSALVRRFRGFFSRSLRFRRMTSFGHGVEKEEEEKDDRREKQMKTK